MFDEDQRSYRSCEMWRKTFTSVDQALISSPEPLGKFQLNLAQIIFG